MPNTFVRFAAPEVRDHVVAIIEKEKPRCVYKSLSIPTIAILNLTKPACGVLEQSGAKTYSSVRFEKFENDAVVPEDLGFPANSSLQNVLEQIRAPQAWERTAGAGATIVIIDSGVDGKRDEFKGKRLEVAINSEHAGVSVLTDLVLDC